MLRFAESKRPQRQSNGLAVSACKMMEEAELL